VRGGPDTAAKLRAHAERLRRAFVLDGAPVLGISMFAALDDLGPASMSGLQAGRLSTYRVVHLVSIGRLVGAGLSLLPTFARPHMTVLMDSLDQASTLLDLQGGPQPNPGMVRRGAEGEGDRDDRRRHSRRSER
jgi:hypothetical protein